MSISVVGAGAGQTVSAGPESIPILEDGSHADQALRTRSPIQASNRW